MSEVRDHLWHLRPKILQAIRRDEKVKDVEAQRFKNNRLLENRMRNWLYNHQIKSVTGIRKAYSRNVA